MSLARPALVCVLCLAACGPSKTDPNRQGGAADEVSIGPIDLQPGQELTRCVTVALNNASALDAIEIDSALAPGSHHLVVYRTTAPEQMTPFACEPFEGLLTQEDVPIYIAETLENKLVLPAGVAYHLEAGQHIKLEAHYINTTLGPLAGHGTVRFTPGVARDYQAADIMFCGTTGQLVRKGVPPNVSDFRLDPGIYSGSSSVDLTQLKVFAFTSHEHHLGSGVLISKSSSRNEVGTVLYENHDWAEPHLQVYDDDHLLTFGPTEGLRWQCAYDSLDAQPPPTGTTYLGTSALRNEMCFLWVYYFPAADHFISFECLQ